jgi:hypothetical protein
LSACEEPGARRRAAAWMIHSSVFIVSAPFLISFIVERQLLIFDGSAAWSVPSMETFY